MPKSKSKIATRTDLLSAEEIFENIWYEIATPEAIRQVIDRIGMLNLRKSSKVVDKDLKIAQSPKQLQCSLWH